VKIPVIIVGAGACGLTAALAARDAGAEVLLLERDASPSGSTALSSGFIPAADTRYQRAAGIEDSPELFAAVWGYLSGNGLLSAVGLGSIAGAQAARFALRRN